MKRYLLGALACVILFAVPAFAQSTLVNVMGSQISDSRGSSGGLLDNATITFAPVLTNGTPASFRRGVGGGQVVVTPISTPVVNGIFSLTVADTSLTSPLNMCYSVTITDNVTGNSLLGGGYSCVQPSNTQSWCSVSGTTTTCNFDAYTPNVDPLAQIEVGATGPVGPPLAFLGLWSSSITYTVGQAVSFSNAVYISLTNANVNNNPSSSTANWSVVQTPASLLSLPGATQTVTQPAGTTLSVNSLNGVLNATLFAGSDIGAKINAAFASCTSTCLVTIPPGSYTYSTTITMTLPSQSLIGAGSGFTRLNYTGSGDAVLWQMTPFTATKAGTLKGFTFACTSSSANCIHSGTVQGSTWEDLVIFGATKANAAGILLENINQGGFADWTERTYMHNVHLGASGIGNTNGLDFRVNGGTGSFGYSDLDLWFNVQPGQTGINVEANAAPYHSSIVAKGNIDAEPATFLRVAGEMVNDSVFIVGETTGNTASAVANDIVVTSTGSVVATGNIAIANGVPGAPANNLDIPNVAPGGVYKVGVFTDLNYPGGSNFAVSQNNVIEKAFLPVSADGQIQIASGSLVGRFVIEWPNNTSRYDAMTVDVSCTAFEGQPCLLSSSDYAFGASPVFSNPRVFRDSGGVVPYLVLNVGNRNGISQNMIVTWMGSAANAPNLFPAGTLGASPQTTYGYTFSQAGSNVVQSGASGPAGTCTVPNGFIPVTINGATVHLATCP